MEAKILERHMAYATLTAELEFWRHLPFEELVNLVGASPSIRSEWVGNEVIDLEVRVIWAPARPVAFRVEAVAGGPSCWRLERLEEAITVQGGGVGG